MSNSRAMTSPQGSMEAENNNISPVYYGICMSDAPPDTTAQTPLVFMDKAEVLKQVKKYPGARFKAFSSQEEACHFSTNKSESSVPVPMETMQNFEKSFAFRAPKSQELVKLRKAIERGDVQYFSSMIWTNPRYLIASGDTPTILQEGFHYTALHVAAKFNQPVICKLLLNAIHDLKFLQLLYEGDPLSVQERRIEFLTDLYLNLPDKGLSETPLHFACKFGCTQVVEILLSYPACDRHHSNKYQQTARQIICDRCSSPNKPLRKEIDNLFEDRYFVPVLRSEDDSLTPVLGKPFSPENVSGTHTNVSLTSVLGKPFSSEKKSGSHKNVSSPTHLSLKIRAIAGPMSPELSRQFYKEWKGPSSPMTRLNCKSENVVRRTDSGKGLERIGRVLAKEHQVHWNEYWPFLDSWCNLSTSNGIIKLEQHFQQVHKKILENHVMTVLESSEHCEMRTPETKKCYSDTIPIATQEKEPEFSPVTKLCKELENFHISSRTKIPRTTMESTDVHQCSIRNICASGTNENDTVRRVLSFDSPIGEKCSVKRVNNKNCSAPEQNEISLKEIFQLESDSEEWNNPMLETFYTPPTSPSSLDSSLHTPEEIQSFFIMGLLPSKVDFDVLNALEGVTIDPNFSPLVYLWKEKMNDYPYDQFTGAFTPQSVSTENYSFYSLSSYETNENVNSRQQCWTFPVKRNHF